MAISLFTDLNEETYFYDLLAARKLKDKRIERKNYEQEIVEALDACGKILMQNGARCNFIAEIEKADNSISKESNSDALLVKQILDNDPRPDSFSNFSAAKDELLKKKETLTEEFASFIEGLAREVREDLEFLSKQVVNRRARCAANLEDENAILNYYPNAETIDYAETFGVLRELFLKIDMYVNKGPIFDIEDIKPKVVKKAERTETIKDTDSIDISPAENAQKSEKVISDNRSLPSQGVQETKKIINISDYTKVVKIKKAPKNLQDNVNPDKKLIEAVATPITVTDNSFFAPVDATNIPEEFNPFNIGDLNAPIPDLESSQEEVLDIVSEEPRSSLIQETVPESIEPVIAESPPNSENFKFEMPIGMTLTVLAEALCDDANGWMDIYAANKKQIDEELAKKNYTNFDNLENDATILAGMKLEIPTVFKKEAKSHLGKVA